MMVSEQTHALSLSKPINTSPHSTAAGSAIAFPPSLMNEMATLENMVTTTPVLSGDSTSSLPFDEQLIGLPSDAAYAEAMTAIMGSMTPTTTNTTTTASTPFVVDTAALAQQIAGLIQDEKKLSDNILNIIPSPQTNPMLMRALSPPTSLLGSGESKGIPPLSLPSTTTRMEEKRKASEPIQTNFSMKKRKPNESMPESVLTREKVMKEPQSGDLYECVITKRNGGLGLTLACVDDHVQITGLAPETPAAQSGICIGDTLVAVSGLPVRGLQFSTVIGRLKSSSRHSVVLKLRRNPFRPSNPSSSSSSSSSTVSKPPANLYQRNNVVPTTTTTPSPSPQHLVSRTMKTEPSHPLYQSSNESLSHPDTDRYFTECRRLRRELAHVLVWKRRCIPNRSTSLEQIAQSFEHEMQMVMNMGEDLIALRQKLLQVNHAFARQETEMVALKERDGRHAMIEARRIQREMILEIQSCMMQVQHTKTSSRHQILIPGVRSSVFMLLFSTPFKSMTLPRIELTLEHKVLTEMLSWNLEEVVDGWYFIIGKDIHVVYQTEEEMITFDFYIHGKSLKE